MAKGLVYLAALGVGSVRRRGDSFPSQLHQLTELLVDNVAVRRLFLRQLAPSFLLYTLLKVVRRYQRASTGASAAAAGGGEDHHVNRVHLFQLRVDPLPA